MPLDQPSRPSTPTVQTIENHWRLDRRVLAVKQWWNPDDKQWESKVHGPGWDAEIQEGAEGEIVGTGTFNGTEWTIFAVMGADGLTVVEAPVQPDWLFPLTLTEDEVEAAMRAEA